MACSYTGSGGGANPIERMICADDATGIASIMSANNSERTERLRIVFPLLIIPRLPGSVLLVRAAWMKRRPTSLGHYWLAWGPSWLRAYANESRSLPWRNLLTIAHSPSGSGWRRKRPIANRANPWRLLKKPQQTEARPTRDIWAKDDGPGDRRAWIAPERGTTHRPAFRLRPWRFRIVLESAPPIDLSCRRWFASHRRSAWPQRSRADPVNCFHLPSI